MTLARALREAKEVVLHTYGAHHHTLKVNKSQVRQLATDNGLTLNQLSPLLAEWQFDGFTLHIHT